MLWDFRGEKDEKGAGVKESSQAEVAFELSIKDRAEDSLDRGSRIKRGLGSAGKTQEIPRMARSLG